MDVTRRSAVCSIINLASQAVWGRVTSLRLHSRQATMKKGEPGGQAGHQPAGQAPARATLTSSAAGRQTEAGQGLAATRSSNGHRPCLPHSWWQHQQIHLPACQTPALPSVSGGGLLQPPHLPPSPPVTQVPGPRAPARGRSHLRAVP